LERKRAAMASGSRKSRKTDVQPENEKVILELSAHPLKRGVKKI
jgi:hypothetical protein